MAVPASDQTGGSEQESPFTGEFRGKIYDSILHTIGATPLVRVSRQTSSASASSSIRCPASRTVSV
jgi:hypothetical protein